MVVTLSQWFVVCTWIVPYVYEYTQYYWVTVFFLSLSLCFLCLLAIFPLFFHSLTQSSPIWILTRYWAAHFWACDLCLFFKEGSYALVENPFSSYFPLSPSCYHSIFSSLKLCMLSFIEYILCARPCTVTAYILLHQFTQPPYEGEPVTLYFIHEKNRARCNLPKS